MSNINTNAIDTTYPVPGINNSTQGFRDNFTSIKLNLNAAGTEISDIQSKAVVKSALTGTVLNNDMANTLISNAAVQGFRAKTYNMGSNLGSEVMVNVSKADVQYGTITQNTAITFGGWAPSGTQCNVQLILTVANSAAYITFPTTTVSSGGNITLGMTPSARLLENYSSNGYVTNSTTYTNMVGIPNGVKELHYNFSTIDCGSTLEVEPINRPQRATQLTIRTPAAIGAIGDAPGLTCTDGSYIYICFGTYDGTSHIWGKVALTAVS